MVGARQLWLCPIGTFERDHRNILGGFLNWGGGASRLANYRCWRASHTTSGRRRSASLLTFGSWCPHAGMFTFFFFRVCSSKLSLYLSSPPLLDTRVSIFPLKEREAEWETAMRVFRRLASTASSRISIWRHHMLNLSTSHMFPFLVGLFKPPTWWRATRKTLVFLPGISLSATLRRSLFFFFPLWRRLGKKFKQRKKMLPRDVTAQPSTWGHWVRISSLCVINLVQKHSSDNRVYKGQWYQF